MNRKENPRGTWGRKVESRVKEPGTEMLRYRSGEGLDFIDVIGWKETAAAFLQHLLRARH